MAGNLYLTDKTIQEQLAAHDPLLIKYTSTRYPGQTPVEHCDFNRNKEHELLDAYLNQFTDSDFQDGNVLVEDAVRVMYGTVDGYLLGRLTKTHLHPASPFNKKVMTNGQVVVADPTGTYIVRDDRRALALGLAQSVKDKLTPRISKTVNSANKTWESRAKVALRIDPSAKNGVTEIKRQMLEEFIGTFHHALNPGDE